MDNNQIDTIRIRERLERAYRQRHNTTNLEAQAIICASLKDIPALLDALAVEKSRVDKIHDGLEKIIDYWEHR